MSTSRRTPTVAADLSRRHAQHDRRRAARGSGHRSRDRHPAGARARPARGAARRGPTCCSGGATPRTATVDDEVVERVREPRLGGDGADRPPFRALLENLQAPDGDAVQPEMARGGRARAHLGDQPQPPDRGRARRARRDPDRPRCTASRSPCRSRTRRCSSPGTRAARCSARA